MKLINPTTEFTPLTVQEALDLGRLEYEEDSVIRTLIIQGVLMKRYWDKLISYLD